MHKKLKSKTDDRGLLAIYLGRAIDHSEDTHRFLNLTTNKVIVNRNAKFLGITYNDYYKNAYHNNQYASLMDNDDDDDDDETFDPIISPSTTTTQTEINLNTFLPPPQTNIHHHNTRQNTTRTQASPPPTEDDYVPHDLPDLVLDTSNETENITQSDVPWLDTIDETFPANYVPRSARAVQSEILTTNPRTLPVDKSTKLFREMRRLNGFF
jgi:hypothetical protein